MALNSVAPLTFEDLQLANATRCEQVYHGIDEWSETDWMCAAAGELGEAANLIKKRRRGENICLEDVMDEIADCVIYLDLLSTRLSADLAGAVIRKFNVVSERTGSTVHIG